MNPTSAAALRQRLAFYLDTVVASREPLTVTRPTGKGDVVIVAAEEYAALEETVHLLSSPANAARLLASVENAKAGATRERDLVPARKAARRA